jgi:hypothetical protein
MATATAVPILNVQSSDNELAKQTVFIKVHLGLLGNTRKVNPSQVEVDADKALIRVSKTLLDSAELQAIRALDGDVRHFLYDMCLPFDVGIHLLPLCLVETVEEKLRELKEKRRELVESFLSAYPRLWMKAITRSTSREVRRRITRSRFEGCFRQTSHFTSCRIRRSSEWTDWNEPSTPPSPFGNL